MPKRSRHQSPHEALISSKYEKALLLVQQLTASSGIQPSKEQKLQLYACYKQVSGDVNTPRPGLFDVIGRAKWDAWKNMGGTEPINAKERYVNILLQVASEAFQKSGANENARNILQALGSTKLDEPVENTAETTDSQDLSDSDSDNAEEQAYLAEIQRDQMESNPAPTSSYQRSMSEAGIGATRRQTQAKYARSLADSAIAARPRFQSHDGMGNLHRSRRSSHSSVSTTDNVRSRYRARSVTSNQSGHRTNRSLVAGSLRDRRNISAPIRNRYSTHEDDFTGATRLWAQVANSSGQLPWDEFDSDDSIEDEKRATDASISEVDHTEVLMRGHLRNIDTSTPLPRHTGPLSSQSIASASSTAPRPSMFDSQRSSRAREQYMPTHSEKAPQSPSVSVVDLGPATKRALQSLQSEVIALNGRLDGLKSELLEKDHLDPSSKGKKPLISKSSTRTLGSYSRKAGEKDDDDKKWEGWKWVVKVSNRSA
ncbi:hypothetical protein NQZ79_g5535 [Umbelopsis isabellina]|nr:hypothetical protein NQZ79_g5535 [Umbelopsis isabellina]